MSHKMFLGLASVFLVLSCGSSHVISDNSISTIDYKITEKRIFADSIKMQVQKMQPGIEKQTTEKNLQSVENPNPSFYRLTVGKDISRLSYLPSLDTGEGAAYTSESTPFTKENSYRFQDSSSVYVDFSSRIPEAVMKVPHQVFEWRKTSRDTVFSGIKAQLYIGANDNAEVRAWITEEFSNNLGVYDLYSKKGFILAYELKTGPEPPFKEQIFKVYPQKVRSTPSRNINAPTWSKEMSKKEILKYFATQNKQ